MFRVAKIYTVYCTFEPKIGSGLRSSFRRRYVANNEVVWCARTGSILCKRQKQLDKLTSELCSQKLQLQVFINRYLAVYNSCIVASQQDLECRAPSTVPSKAEAKNLAKQVEVSRPEYAEVETKSANKPELESDGSRPRGSWLRNLNKEIKGVVWNFTWAHVKAKASHVGPCAPNSSISPKFQKTEYVERFLRPMELKG